MAILTKILSITLGAVIIILTGTIAYITLSPHQQDQFTEFYILNIDGKAADYPRQVKVGEPVNLIIGVINRENAPSDYKIVLKLDGQEIDSLETGTLKVNERWEKKVSTVASRAGSGQRLELYLYLNHEVKPHIKDPLVLIVDVAAQ